MTDRPLTDLYSANAELNVSIAGSSHETMADALDEAVARLDMATAQPSVAGQAPNSIDLPQITSLLQSICAGETRRNALAELVTFLDARSADCTVRGGIGRDRLARVYDPRLGWLGPESTLFDQLEQRWQIDAENKSQPEASVFGSATATVMVMHQSIGPGCCIVWIDGPEEQRQRVAWLPSLSSAIAAALWSRPSQAWTGKLAQACYRRSKSVTFAGALLAIAALWPVHYRVACRARVETAAQRLVSPSFDAKLERSNFRPGDTVRAGDVLIVLDGRPLRLEREAIEAERQQVAKEHDAALATSRIAEAQQAALKERRLSRRYDLLSDRLQNLEVVSPIDGVVVSGDLDRYVGSPLERGQAVMEIAPMNRMVIEIEIPEHEIGYIEDGAETRIKIDAIGGKSLRKPIANVFPRAELRDDQNVFIAKIEVDNSEFNLKPGMRGDATTYGPLRPWLWSWIRGGWEKVLWWIGY